MQIEVIRNISNSSFVELFDHLTKSAGYVEVMDKGWGVVVLTEDQ